MQMEKRGEGFPAHTILSRQTRQQYEPYPSIPLSSTIFLIRPTMCARDICVKRSSFLLVSAAV